MKLIMENWRDFLLQEIPGLDGQGTSLGQHHVLSQRDDQKAYAASQMVAKGNREFINKFIIDYTFARATVYAGMMVAKEINSMMLGVLSLGQIGDIKLDPLDPGNAELVSSYQMVKDAAAATDSALKEKKYKEASLSAAGTVLMALGMFPGVGKYLQKAGKPLTDAASKKIINSTNNIIIKAKDVSKKLKKSKDPELINKAKEIEVKLPSSGQMKNYIERNREMGRLGYVDDGSKAAKKRLRVAQGKGIPDEILKKVSSRTHPSLSKYKFSRLKPGQFPKTVYHGSRTNQLSIDKISPMKRPRGKDAFDAHWDDAAGFYTHSFETASSRYATGKKATMYSFEVNPNAKVYAYTPPKGEKYKDGWHFIRLNNKDIKALRKKGVDALYDDVADEFIIIGNPKKVFSKIKSKPVNK